MLRDLGLYALRGLGHPEHLFELVARDLAGGFPALRDGAVPERSAGETPTSARTHRLGVGS